MRTIGFPISKKENEKRRAVKPIDLNKVRNTDMLYFETGYGEVIGFTDKDYQQYGCHMVSREEVLNQDIICDPKVGDAGYLSNLKRNQIIFGWVHAVQNKAITDNIVNNKATAYTWEDMYIKGRHCFWRNNEVAGEAAIMHAFECYGKMPYNLRIALLGRGNVANGALKILTVLGADITIYNRTTEKLFQEELSEFDVVVNAILWDTSRRDHIIYRNDLKRMKSGAMIIDISCDVCGGIETTVATTIENPIYKVDGIIHYAVDHTPSIFYKTATEGISREVVKYLDDLVENKPNEILKNALAIEDGVIIDQRINQFQNRV